MYGMDQFENELKRIADRSFGCPEAAVRGIL